MGLALALLDAYATLSGAPHRGVTQANRRSGERNCPLCGGGSQRDRKETQVIAEAESL